MPIYDYRCRNCGARFDALVRTADEASCPECGSRALDQLLTVPYVAKTSSAPQAGHTCCGREERCAAPPCSDDGTCRRG